MKFRIKLISYEYILIYILAFCIIYSSGALLVTLERGVMLKNSFRITILLISCILVIKSIRNVKNLVSTLVFAICTSLYLIVNIMHHSETSTSLIYFCIRFLLFFSLSLYMNNVGILIERVIYKIVLVISIVFFVFFILINILHVNLPYTVVYRIADSRWLDCYFDYFGIYEYRPYNSAVASILGFNFVRVSGFFWEPGLYGVYLNYALYVYMKNNINNRRQLMLILLMSFLTASTTCWAVSSILIAVMIWKSNIISKVKSIAFVPLGTLSIALSINIIVSKIKNTNLTRINDIVYGIQILSQNLVLGTGYENVSLLYSLTGQTRGNSNGLVTWLFTMGILGAIVLIIPFVANYLLRNYDCSNSEYLIFILIFTMWNMTEPITTMAFISLLIAVEYSKLFQRSRFLHFFSKYR